ncbi:MAG TPA: hypothetical protein VHV51_25760 [Polyangiaceae bacterium]|jgi:hypothetical protein|nr:hypothetical protein [Polyangiaceae bacterium]
MKLSDVMSAMHMSIYAEVPLLIFLGIFLGVGIYLFEGKERFHEASLLPLQRENARRSDAP